MEGARMRKLFVLLGAMALTVGLASPAQGNPNTEDLPGVETKYYDGKCGKVIVGLLVPEGVPEWNYKLQVEVEGEIVGSTDLVQGPGKSFFKYKLDEDSFDGSAEVKYYFIDAQEWDLVPEGLNYQDTYPDVGDAHISFNVDTDCVPDSTPTPTPSETASPTATPTPTNSEPSATPTQTVSPSETTNVDEASATLPKTGSTFMALVIGGLTVLALGGGLTGGMWWLNRRRIRALSNE